jgi:hypothetical protein
MVDKALLRIAGRNVTAERNNDENVMTDRTLPP